MERKEQIKELIKSSKISFKTVGESMHVSREMIVNWTNGKGTVEDNQVLDALIRKLEKALELAKELREKEI